MCINETTKYQSVKIEDKEEPSTEDKIAEFVDTLINVGSAVTKLKKDDEEITIEVSISSK